MSFFSGVVFLGGWGCGCSWDMAVVCCAVSGRLGTEDKGGENFCDRRLKQPARLIILLRMSLSFNSKAFEKPVVSELNAVAAASHESSVASHAQPRELQITVIWCSERLCAKEGPLSDVF